MCTQVLEKIQVGVNRHFGDAERLRAVLSRYGVTQCREFGQSEPPEQWSVAIDENLSDAQQKEIKEIASEFGFDSYFPFCKLAECLEEDVFFGHYGQGVLRTIPGHA